MRKSGATLSSVAAAAIKLVSNMGHLALRQGQWRSMANRAAIDAKGHPIPWYTYPAIEFLRCFDFSRCDVFEFGAGNSSQFWAGLSRTIVSVEDDEIWYEQVRSAAKSNQQILLKKHENDYVESLASRNARFDVIVIDGKWRKRCVEQAIEHVREGGMIILDNADWYPDSCKALRARGFFQMDFSGFGPINGYCWTTSLFIRASCDLQSGFAAPHPIGGIRQHAD